MFNGNGIQISQKPNIIFYNKTGTHSVRILYYILHIAMDAHGNIDSNEDLKSLIKQRMDPMLNQYLSFKTPHI